MKKCALALVLFVMIFAIQSVGAKAEAQAEPYSGAGIAIIAEIKDLRDYEAVLSDGGVSALFLDINGAGDAVGSGGEKIASLSFLKTEINKNGKSAVLRLRDETSAEAVLNELNGDDDVTLFSENGQKAESCSRRSYGGERRARFTGGNVVRRCGNKKSRQYQHGKNRSAHESAGRRRYRFSIKKTAH